MEDCEIKIVLNGDSMEFLSKDLGIDCSDSMSGAGGCSITENCKDEDKAILLLQEIHQKLHDLYYLFNKDNL